MKELAKSILQLVGGKENVKNCTHCVTRLRLLLVDESKADTEAIKKMNGVLAVVNKGGQYQIVLGDKVNDVYDEFVVLMGGESGAAAATPQKKKRDVKNFSAALLDLTTSIFSPTIGALAAGGMLKGILVALAALNLMSSASPVHIKSYTVQLMQSSISIRFCLVILPASGLVWIRLWAWLSVQHLSTRI